jgi:hypothetical protein
MTELPQNFEANLPANFTAFKDLTLDQVEKDFSLQGIRFRFSDRQSGYPKLIGQLSDFLREGDYLQKGNFFSLLYQWDISAHDLRSRLSGKPESELYHHLAAAVLERCFRKVYLRQKLSGNQGKEKS